MKTFFISFYLLSFAVLLLFFLSCFYGFFYPIRFETEINQYASMFEIKPEIIASVINVESNYKENRVSCKGAVGLMQIMPTTAQWIADNLNESFDENELFLPEKNIKYGAYYISYLLKYFNDLNLSICAYNAGMGNVKSWMQNKNIYYDGKLNEIPFKETENYLEKVLKNIRYYEKHY